MPRPPELIEGFVFDEPFFDAVIKQAGGHRLEELHTPPPDTKHVDYLISGYALELKTLVIDPLESPERQTKLAQFLRSEFPHGPLYVTATRREATLTGPLAKKFWSWYIGSSIKDALDRASDQINDTRKFVPGPLLGAVLLVNAGATSMDWRSFINLANTYQDRLPAIDAVFALHGVPDPRESDTGLKYYVASIVKNANKAPGEALAKLLENSIQAELSRRLGRKIHATNADPHAVSPRLPFQISRQDGMIRKKVK